MKSSWQGALKHTYLLQLEGRVKTTKDFIVGVAEPQKRLNALQVS